MLLSSINHAPLAVSSTFPRSSTRALLLGMHMTQLLCACNPQALLILVTCSPTAWIDYLSEGAYDLEGSWQMCITPEG